MADFRVQGDEIKRLVKIAKKAPVALAFNPGGGEEDGYLAMHKVKSPEILGKEAKSEGEGGKFTFGMAAVAGKVLSLTCQRDLPGAAKKLKKYLKSQKVVLNVVILDAEGNVLESDIEEDLPDDPELAEAEEGEGEGEGEGDGAALRQRIEALRRQLAALPPAAAAGPLAALEKIGALLDGGEAERAESGLDKLAALIARLPQDGAPPAAPPPPDPRLARLAQAAVQLRGEIAAIGDEKARATMTAALARAVELLRTGEVEQALALMKKLQEALRGAGRSADEAQPARVLPLWSAARDTTGEQIGKLQAQLRQSGLPLFERIADKGLNGVTDGQLTGMQAALMDYEAAAGPAREAAREKLRAAIAAMRGFLSSNPVLPLLDANPFGVEVTIRASLGGALDAIDAAITA